MASQTSNQLISRIARGAASKQLYNKPDRLSRFVDSIRVKFQGGKGADGCISMLHVFANEFAGPDGGDGGCGGHVVLRANNQIKSLNALSTSYHGLPGSRGEGKNMYGANASHTFVEVPIGTVVSPAKPKELAEHEFDPNKSDVVAELDQDGSMFIAARGGAGGRGNASYLSNTNRHPRVAEAGAFGEANVYNLRLKFYAHIGLIGLPNAGKSSLLRTMTQAKVKIGDYAFTTLYPQVGVIEYDDYTQVAISDLPGLIEGSHKNHGLGVSFLRSVQRCTSFLYLVDLTGDPIKELETLFFELESFKEGLSSRPHVIVGNKIDDCRAEANVGPLKDYLRANRPDSRLILTSASRGDNLEEVRIAMRELYDKYRANNMDDLSDTLVW